MSHCTNVIMSHASLYMPIDNDTVALFSQSAIIGKAKQCKNVSFVVDQQVDRSRT